MTAAGMLLGLFLILSAIIWIGERASSDRRKADLRAIRTQTVLLEAQHLLSVLQDTETAQRGYVMTASPGFLEPYEAGRKEVGASLDRLAEMTLDSPIQQARIRELGNIIAAKIAKLSEIVALLQAGNQPGAVSVIMTERGMSRIDEARSIVDGAIAEEQRQQTLLSVAVDEAFTRDRHLSHAFGRGRSFDPARRSHGGRPDLTPDNSGAIIRGAHCFGRSVAAGGGAGTRRHCHV
jgi:CHASE3 domain sensor protein